MFQDIFYSYLSAVSNGVHRGEGKSHLHCCLHNKNGRCSRPRDNIYAKRVEARNRFSENTRIVIIKYPYAIWSNQSCSCSVYYFYNFFFQQCPLGSIFVKARRVNNNRFASFFTAQYFGCLYAHCSRYCHNCKIYLR